jgi:5'-nucleotidase
MQYPKTTRRTFVASTTAAGAGLLLANQSRAATSNEQNFTILHINDLHSNLLGVGPVSEYTPNTADDDSTIGGIARIATLIAKRKSLRSKEGPVLSLDIGDFTVGAAFGGAMREIGSELQCLSMSGFERHRWCPHAYFHPRTAGG